jgi:uroporphyrinogen decarboxylase
MDAINEADDMAGQTNLLLSPKTYRTIIKPYHCEYSDAIKQSKPDAKKIILHTCGAVRKLIPDLTVTGVDVLNPVQPSPAGKDPVELKTEFVKISVSGGRCRCPEYPDKRVGSGNKG